MALEWLETLLIDIHEVHDRDWHCSLEKVDYIVFSKSPIEA